ncbi:MAG: TonB-dependent receptor [Lautropia sp.]|nr:TonB-dependent receptor [Lautropia sp.]
MSSFSIETVKRLRLKPPVFSLLLSVSFGQAYSQDSIDQKNPLAIEKLGSPHESDASVLPPVTVTARKIKEDIQKTPLSVTVKTDMDLENKRIQKTQELARWVPNFNFSDSGIPFANLLNIRGIGSSSALISPSVIYYIDDLPVPTRIFDQRFLDVSQVEVLRGPQGVLFGLNAQAGVVNIKTNVPTRTPTSEVGTELSSNQRREYNAMLSGSITDKIHARISAKIHDHGGDLRNYLFDSHGQAIGRDRVVREESLGTFSGKALIEPDKDTKITLFGSYRHDHLRPTTGLLLDDPYFPRTSLNPVPTSTIENETVGLKVERLLNHAQLTSITGYQHYDIGMTADLIDGFLGSAQTGNSPYLSQPPGVNSRKINEKHTQLTHEFRLSGGTAEGMRWVSGLSALYSNLDSTTDVTSLRIANGSYTGKIKTMDLGVFGDITLPATEKLRYIAGLRGTYESQKFNGLFLGRNGANSHFDESGSLNYSFLTGRTGLTYDVTSEATAFITISRGKKTGGYLHYNQSASSGVSQPPYKSATTWSYEAGLRGTLLNHRIRYSVSAFLNNNKNEQLFTYNPSIGLVSAQNADTRTYGTELEFKAHATKNLSLGANLSILHAKVVGGQNTSLIGNDVPYAPEFTAGIFAEYRHPFMLATISGSAFGRIEYQYTDSREIDPANSRRLAGYDLTNLRAGWQTGRFQIYMFVENLFNKEYVTSSFLNGRSPSGQNVFAGIPGLSRTLGTGVKIYF